MTPDSVPPTERGSVPGSAATRMFCPHGIPLDGTAVCMYCSGQWAQPVQPIQPRLVYPPLIPQGWQCPVCGTVYAPTVANCHNAHEPPPKVTTGANDA